LEYREKNTRKGMQRGILGIGIQRGILGIIIQREV